MPDQLVEVEEQDQPVEVVVEVEVVFNTAVHVICNTVLHVISITAYVIPSKVHVFLCKVSYVTTSLTVHVTRNVVEHVTHVTRVHNVILVPMNPMNIIAIHLSLLHNAYSASLYASLHLSLRCIAIRTLQIYINVYNLID